MMGRASSPTLETVQMIEGFIRKNSPSRELIKTQVWKRLPRKVMYQTFCAAFDYLMASKKNRLSWKHARSYLDLESEAHPKGAKAGDLTWKLDK